MRVRTVAASGSGRLEANGALSCVFLGHFEGFKITADVGIMVTIWMSHENSPASVECGMTPGY